MPLSPLDLMAAAPSAKAFFTKSTISALLLNWSRLGSSSAGIFLPMAGLLKKYTALEAWSSCSAKLRWAGVGLKSYLSSGKSSAMAMTFRATSFQVSSRTFDGPSAGLTAAFFMASCACAGRARVEASRSAAASLSILLFSRVRCADIVIGLGVGGKASEGRSERITTEDTEDWEEGFQPQRTRRTLRKT